MTSFGLALLAACAGSFALRNASADPITPSTRIDRIVVDKDARTMEVFRGSQLIKRYRVAIGRGGDGHKGWEGDGITPEGVYRIDRRHRSTNFHRFLHISYPNRADRRRYRQRLRRGEVPEDDQGLPVGIGGAIGIHGTGGHDWVPHGFRSTAGCVLVNDDEAEELYRAVVPGATIEIR
ncbi:MAG: L,D-transpeptidase family protein [Myxococcota bacterium]